MNPLTKMARNLRHQKPSHQRKMPRRKPSPSPTPDLDDDDGYSAVDDISDSEDDDEESVDAVEAEHIIDESRSGNSRSPRPQSNTVNKEDDGDDEDDDEDNEEANDDAWNGLASESDETSSSDAQGLGVAAAAPIVVERHVRFVDVPSSDSDSTDTDDDHTDLFPDIFVDKGSLDPAFRREIEHDNDHLYSASFWDCLDPYTPSESDNDLNNPTPASTPVASQAPTIVSTPVPIRSDSPELDGYECE